MHATYPIPIDSLPRFDKSSFVKYTKDIGREYRAQAITLVLICRTCVQAKVDTRGSYDELRSVLQAVDDALYSATEARKKTTKDADAKFKKATVALSTFAMKYDCREATYRIAKAENDKSSWTSLKRLKEILPWEQKDESTVLVEFLLHKSLPDNNPTIVKQVLSRSSDIKEVLWNFSRFKGEKRLTLKDNPHFYEKLPTSAEKFGGQFRTEPVETFRQERISVLIDNPRLTGRLFLETAKEKRVFSNVWVPKEAIIFKDVCGKLEGENVIHSVIEATPNLWCFEEPPLSNAPWPSLPDRSSPSPTTTATPITSSTGALLGDWREPILRMLRSQGIKFNICISDKLPTSFSTFYSGPSLPYPPPYSSSIVGSLSPAAQSRPTLGIQIPGASKGPHSPSSYKTARSTPPAQRPPAVELSPRSPTPLSRESPILSLPPLPTPTDNVALTQRPPAVDLSSRSPTPLSRESPILSLPPLPTPTDNVALTQQPPAVELSPRSPAPLPRESPILSLPPSGTPTDNVAFTQRPPAVELSPKSLAPLSLEPPISTLPLLPTPTGNTAPHAPDPTICQLPDTSLRGVSQMDPNPIISSQASAVIIFPQPRIAELHAETNEVERNNSEVLNEDNSDAGSIPSCQNVGDGGVDMKGSKYSLDEVYNGDDDN